MPVAQHQITPRPDLDPHERAERARLFRTLFGDPETRAAARAAYKEGLAIGSRGYHGDATRGWPSYGVQAAYFRGAQRGRRGYNHRVFGVWAPSGR